MSVATRFDVNNFCKNSRLLIHFRKPPALRWLLIQKHLFKFNETLRRELSGRFVSNHGCGAGQVQATDLSRSANSQIVCRILLCEKFREACGFSAEYERVVRLVLDRIVTVRGKAGKVPNAFWLEPFEKVVPVLRDMPV